MFETTDAHEAKLISNPLPWDYGWIGLELEDIEDRGNREKVPVTDRA